MNELGFAKNEIQTTEDQSLVQVEQSRAVAEVQAAYVIAKKFPRNQSECYSNIISACKRPFLAEQAMYAYPRGGSMVTGPSIRLAESMAQSWGNIDCGIREVSQSNGMSVAEAYAIDLQTNTKVSKIFHVPHYRDTKKGKVKLTDSRDIYEMVANQGARRLRACILGVLPGDVVEAAVEQCKKTLESSDVPISDQIKKMIVAFDEFGVKVEHLEKRLGHKMESTIAAEIVSLKGIYKSIKDGMADRTAFFDIGLSKDENAEAILDNLLQDSKKSKVDPKTGEIIQNDKKQ
jgi:hypothetical protein